MIVAGCLLGGLYHERKVLQNKISPEKVDFIENRQNYKPWAPGVDSSALKSWTLLFVPACGSGNSVEQKHPGHFLCCWLCWFDFRCIALSSTATYLLASLGNHFEGWHDGVEVRFERMSKVDWWVVGRFLHDAWFQSEKQSQDSIKKMYKKTPCS